MEAPPETNVPAPAYNRLPFLRRLNPVAFSALSLAIVFVLYQVIAGGAALLLAGATPTGNAVVIFRVTTVVGQLVCILLPTILLARWRGVDLRRFFRLELPDVRALAVTVVAVFALQQMLQGYMAFQDSIPMSPVVQEYVDLFRKIIEESYRVLVSASTPAEFIAVIVAVALVPAICEEFLFRGLVQSSFAEVAGEGRSALLAGVIFGAYHLNPFGIVPLVALGAFFGFLVYRSGSIFLAVSAHFFNNFIAVTATYLQLDDEFVMLAPHGGAGTTLQVLNFGVSAVVFAGAIALFLYLTEEKER